MTVLARVRQVRHHWTLRVTRRGLMITAAAVAVLIVSMLTVDLGPVARRYAEQYATKGLKGRAVHIGALRIKVGSGHFVVRDLSIDGLKTTDRPFFSAKRIEIALSWATLIRRDVTIDHVEMTDWQMLVEKWEGGHNFPKLGDDRPDEPEKPKRWTVTLNGLHAYRGQFTFDDHEKPWSTVARHLDITIANPPSYSGEASFTGGTVTIQDYAPMWTNMRARFRIAKGRVLLDRIDLQSDGATSVATGEVDFKHWPEQTYQVKSRVRFPRMREIFFPSEAWRVSGDGDFTGVFHLFKGGHDLHGQFSSEDRKSVV